MTVTYLSIMHVPESVRLAGEWADDTTPKTRNPVRLKSERCSRRVIGLMGLRQCSRKATHNGRCAQHQEG